MADELLEPTGRRIGILAGGGSLPREIADSIAARRIPVFVLGIGGEVDRSFAPHPFLTVDWGEIGRMLRALREARVTDLLIIGRVRRPDLWKIKADLGLFLALPQILSIVRAGGDDAVLRGVVGFFERKGITVVGPAAVAPEMVVGAGAFGAVAPDPRDSADIAKGFDVVRRLGTYDIGQAVVVAGGVVEAIEGAEGTDGMLERVARHRQSRGRAALSARGVLVKRPKPGQDLRVDLPAIGPETARRAAEAGLAGIAVKAGQVLAAERAALVARADASRIFIAGFEDADVDVARNVPRNFDMSSATGGKVGPDTRVAAAKGAGVLDVMSADNGIGAVVVVGRHVIAVEAGREGVSNVVERAATLRQWGRKRRAGVLVVSAAALPAAPDIAAAARAGIEAIALLQPIEPADVAHLTRAAAAAGLEIISLTRQPLREPAAS